MGHIKITNNSGRDIEVGGRGVLEGGADFSEQCLKPIKIKQGEQKDLNLILGPDISGNTLDVKFLDHPDHKD